MPPALPLVLRVRVLGAAAERAIRRATVTWSGVGTAVDRSCGMIGVALLSGAMAFAKLFLRSSLIRASSSG